MTSIINGQMMPCSPPSLFSSISQPLILYNCISVCFWAFNSFSLLNHCLPAPGCIRGSPCVWCLHISTCVCVHVVKRADGNVESLDDSLLTFRADCNQRKWRWWETYVHVCTCVPSLNFFIVKVTSTNPSTISLKYFVLQNNRLNTEGYDIYIWYE